MESAGITAFLAGFVSFPVIVVAASIVCIFVAAAVDSGLLALFFVVLTVGVLVWSGVGLLAFFATHPIVFPIDVLAYLPISYLWGIKFKLPREADKEAERTKSQIAKFTPDFLRECKQRIKAENETNFFVDVPMMTEEKRRAHPHGGTYTQKTIDPELQTQLLSELGKGVIPAILEKSFKKFLQEKDVGKPSPFIFKDRMFFWVAFWPWSMIKYVVTEMFWDFITAVYRHIRDFWNYVWQYLTGIVTRAINEAYRKAGIDHLVSEKQ